MNSATAPGPLAAVVDPLPSVLGSSAAFEGPVADVNNSIIDRSINSINAITVKLPKLWQSKAQFVTSGVTASLTKYYHVIKALQESSIEHIPELLVPPTDDPYLVLKCQLIELYNLSDYERAEFLMVLPQVDGDMRPSMLLDKMRALTPPEELQRLTSLFWYAFLSRLPSDICVHCVPFVGVKMPAVVVRSADAQFRARET